MKFIPFSSLDFSIRTMSYTVSHIAASSTIIDDVAYYIARGIFNTNLCSEYFLYTHSLVERQCE